MKTRPPDLQRMSLPGRPKGEYRSAQHEGGLMSLAALALITACATRH